MGESINLRDKFSLGLQKVDDSSSAIESFSSRHRISYHFITCVHQFLIIPIVLNRSSPSITSFRWKSKLHTGRRIREKDSSAPPPLVRYGTWLRYLSILNSSSDWPSQFPSRLIDFSSIFQWPHSGSIGSNTPRMGAIRNNRSGSSSLSHLAPLFRVLLSFPSVLLSSLGLDAPFCTVPFPLSHVPPSIHSCPR